MEKQPENLNTGESLERKKLRELESTGQYVFHGSGSKLDILEPRQAHNYPTDSEEGKVPDDKPAVFASPSADAAIFRAIVHINNAPEGLRSGFGVHDDGSFDFRATKETMDQIHNAIGYVHVFDKNKFTPRSAGEVLSYDSVEPLEVIKVTEKDLPKNIEIKDF